MIDDKYLIENANEYLDDKVRVIESNIIGWRVGSLVLNPEAGGIWFAETKDGAERFGRSMRNNKSEANQYKITWKNPKYFNDFWHDYVDTVFPSKKYGNDRGKYMLDLIDMGYDGMYIDTSTWNDTGKSTTSVTSKQYVIFDPKQATLIK